MPPRVPELSGPTHEKLPGLPVRNHLRYRPQHQGAKHALGNHADCSLDQHRMGRARRRSDGYIGGMPHAPHVRAQPYAHSCELRTPVEYCTTQRPGCLAADRLICLSC